MCVSCPASTPAETPSNPAEEHFARGAYQEGVRILKKTAGDRSLSTADRTAAMIALAMFYESRVGDVTRAMAGYRRALKRPVDEKVNALLSSARTELDRLTEREQTHRRLNDEIRRMKADSFKRIQLNDIGARQRLAANVDRLQQIIDSQPDYYRLHDVYYALGLTRLTLDQPYRAYRAFNRALKRKPAMSLAQPVVRLSEKSRVQWLRRLGRQSAWSTMGVLLAVLVLGGARSRPWRWLRFRHLAAGLVVIAAWCALYFLAQGNLADGDAAGGLINNDNIYPTPVFIHLALGEPGSEVARYLFFHGLVAVTGVFLFAAVVGRMRPRSLALISNLAFAVLFCGSLATFYYLDHCDTLGRLYTPEATITAALSRGYLAYPMNDPEPYLLINPLYYRGLDLSSVDDPVLIDWLKSYAIASGGQ
jgi:tetratricopeptide (TPR) repeat protein